MMGGKHPGLHGCLQRKPQKPVDTRMASVRMLESKSSGSVPKLRSQQADRSKPAQHHMAHITLPMVYRRAAQQARAKVLCVPMHYAKAFPTASIYFLRLCCACALILRMPLRTT